MSILFRPLCVKACLLFSAVYIAFKPHLLNATKATLEYMFKKEAVIDRVKII